VTKAPSRTEILDVVSTVLERDLGVQSSSAIDEHTRFFADLGLASIDAVVLGERLQEHYGRPLPFDELMAEIGRRTQRDLSIGELVAFLAANLPGANNS
jgi:acyl carrier protein